MLLIKNIKIVDGSGRPPFPADVLIVGDKISAIGNFPNKKADEVIEGLGGFLTPGFIDINTTSDHRLDLFTNPGQKNFLLQGVTTIIGGQCGASLAPLFYGSLESLRKWADTNQVNVNWHTVEEFFKALKKIRLGVNFGTLIGHSTIRRSLIGEDQRDLTDKETKVFAGVINDSINTGAFGLSAGLSYAHSKQTPYNEIKSLVGELAKHNAVFAIHLRDEKDEVYKSVNEALNVYKDTGVKTIISHFLPIKEYEKEFSSALDLIDKKANKMEFYFTVHPFDKSLVPIYTLLPRWAQKGNLELMLKELNGTETEKKILKDLPKFKKDELIIAEARGNDFLAGKSLGEFCQNKKLPLPKGLLYLMKLTKLRALLFHKNINEERSADLLFLDKALIASNSSSPAENDKIFKNELFGQTFTKFLELAAQKKSYFPEKAIQKITSMPASIFGIKNRGLVKEGYFADLTLILNNKVKYVLVNGELAVNDGELQNIRAGQVITK